MGYPILILGNCNVFFKIELDTKIYVSFLDFETLFLI